MLLQRDRRLAPARAFLPPPAPLPRLPDALRRCATIFGPVDLDEVTLIPARSPVRLGVIVRRIVEALDPRGRP